MKFLLFFVSLIFTFIFYIFHSLTVWKDIFWSKISNSFDLTSFSWNLLIESFIFLFIGSIFLYLFSDLKEKWNNKLLSYVNEILYLLFYIVLFYSIYFTQNSHESVLVVIIISFLISDIIFNYISNIKWLLNEKNNLRYLALIINYLSSIFWIFYIYVSGFSFIVFLILVFNIYFNLLIHKKYSNYVSFLISIIIVFFLLYLLCFYLFELYILYI